MILNLEKNEFSCFLQQFFSNTIGVGEDFDENNLTYRRIDCNHYTNEPLPLKSKRYMNIIYQSPVDQNSIYLVLYKLVPNYKAEFNKFLEANYRILEDIGNKYNIVNCKSKVDLIKKKQMLEGELPEKREHHNYMNVPLNYEYYDENMPYYDNNFNYFNDLTLKCKRVIKFDKQSLYEIIVEQLLIYELTYYEGQIHSDNNQALDDITKEIICLTHFLNYKESMKQINLVKARLYKTLSESIKHKNFSHTEELQT